MKKIIAVLLIPLLSVAGVRGAESPSFNYRPVTPGDLERVQADWKKRDLRAGNVEVIHEEDRDGFRVLIVRHDVSSRAHFGAIFVPDAGDLSKLPVAVLPDGLRQKDPVFDVDLNIEKYQTHEPLTDFIKILPAFRGRVMTYQDNGWFSRGDFCDAYDGPADDSIAMLNAAEQILPDVNFDKVLAWGGSRGGNTALLMAVRDPRVHTVIALGAPVDFYRKDWQVEGSDQYRCQFFDDKNEQQSRDRMLASSPLFFEPHENLKAVFLHHDGEDEIVPVWNAHEMAAHLESHSIDVATHVYPGGGHGAMTGEESFWNDVAAGIAAFLSETLD